MSQRARRLLPGKYPWRARRARFPLALWLAVLAWPEAGAAKVAEVCVAGDGAVVRSACYRSFPDAPEYGHHVLGDTPEWNVLSVTWGPGGEREGERSEYAKPAHIFEDVAPRVQDLDGDGRPEIVTVQSSTERGARLAVFSTDGRLRLVAATPYIGTPFRWLAPAGIADLDGDGTTEIAYVDRPHLSRVLRVWRYVSASGHPRLLPVAEIGGVTNHKIGQPTISGGLRACGGDRSLVLADAAWRRILRVRLSANGLTLEDVGPLATPRDFDRALAC